jgi:hypothetical protein
MESNNFDLNRHIKEHRLTPAEVLYQEEYWDEANFLTKLVDHEGLDQNRLHELLIENKKAFEAQRTLTPLARDLNLPQRKRLRSMVGALGGILKNELYSGEIKELARKELERVKRLQEEIGPREVDFGAPTKPSDFINAKIKKLADYLGRFTGGRYSSAHEHRLIAALFNAYHIGQGAWTRENIKRRLYYRDAGA